MCMFHQSDPCVHTYTHIESLTNMTLRKYVSNTDTLSLSNSKRIEAMKIFFLLREEEKKPNENVFWSRLEVLYLIVIYASKGTQRSNKMHTSTVHIFLFALCKVSVFVWCSCHRQKRKWHKVPNSCWLSDAYRFIGFTLLLFPLFTIFVYACSLSCLLDGNRYTAAYNVMPQKGNIEHMLSLCTVQCDLNDLKSTLCLDYWIRLMLF